MEHAETSQILPVEERKRLYQEGMAAYKEKDYAKALPLLLQAAEQGHVQAQFRCGWMYAQGEGVEKDTAKGLQWYEKAAEQGHKVAQYNCGLNYAKGRGTEKNPVKSLYWYEKAAEQGYEKAQLQCGRMYARGEGAEADRTKARYWYEKAAEQGNEKAKAALAEWEPPAQETEPSAPKPVEHAQPEPEHPLAPPAAPQEVPVPVGEPEDLPAVGPTAAAVRPERARLSGNRFVKSISMLLVLLAGWILLSKCGFLPMGLSFPGKLSRQAYGSPYKFTGYGFENQILRYYNLEFLGNGLLKLIELVGSYSPILIIVFVVIFVVCAPVGGVLITSTLVPTLLIIPGLGAALISAICGVVMPILSIVIILQAFAELLG